MTAAVEDEFIAAVKHLDAKGVSGISGNIHMMMWFHTIAQRYTSKPIFMSSFAQLPAIRSAFGAHDKIAIVVASRENAELIEQKVNNHYSLRLHDDHFQVIGLEDVPGITPMLRGAKVDVDAVTPHVV